LVLSAKRLVAAAKFLVAATKNLFVVPNFVAVTVCFSVYAFPEIALHLPAKYSRAIFIPQEKMQI